MPSPGEAPELAGKRFEIGDRVVRNPTEFATVTYVSETHDYAELRYDTGFAFRTNKSEWRRVRR